MLWVFWKAISAGSSWRRVMRDKARMFSASSCVRPESARAIISRRSSGMSGGLFFGSDARLPLGEGPAPELALPPGGGLLEGVERPPFLARLDVDQREPRAVECHDMVDELGGRHAPIPPKRGTMVRAAGSLA